MDDQRAAFNGELARVKDEAVARISALEREKLVLKGDYDRAIQDLRDAEVRFRGEHDTFRREAVMLHNQAMDSIRTSLRSEYEKVLNDSLNQTEQSVKQIREEGQKALGEMQTQLNQANEQNDLLQKRIDQLQELLDSRSEKGNVNQQQFAAPQEVPNTPAKNAGVTAEPKGPSDFAKQAQERIEQMRLDDALRPILRNCHHSISLRGRRKTKTIRCHSQRNRETAQEDRCSGWSRKVLKLQEEPWPRMDWWSS